MTFQADIANDLSLVADGMETITYHHAGTFPVTYADMTVAETGGTDVQVSALAMRLRAFEQERWSIGARRFHVQQNAFTITPKIGDYLVWNSLRYVVDSVDLQTLGTVYVIIATEQGGIA